MSPNFPSFSTVRTIYFPSFPSPPPAAAFIFFFSREYLLKLSFALSLSLISSGHLFPHTFSPRSHFLYLFHTCFPRLLYIFPLRWSFLACSQPARLFLLIFFFSFFFKIVFLPFFDVVSVFARWLLNKSRKRCISCVMFCISSSCAVLLKFTFIIFPCIRLLKNSPSSSIYYIFPYIVFLKFTISFHVLYFSNLR